MKHGKTIEYLKCRADLDIEVDIIQSKRHHWYDCNQVGSYFIGKWIVLIHNIILLNPINMPLMHC